MKFILRYVRQEDGSLKVDKVPIKTYSFGKSQSDKSKYRPNVPLYSQIDFNKGLPSNLVYDFPDGNDTGLDLTPLRNKSLDITEIKQIKDSLQKSVDRQKKAIDDEVDSLLKQQTDTKSDDTSGSSASSD